MAAGVAVGGQHKAAVDKVNEAYTALTDTELKQFAEKVVLSAYAHEPYYSRDQFLASPEFEKLLQEGKR